MCWSQSERQHLSVRRWVPLRRVVWPRHVTYTDVSIANIRVYSPKLPRRFPETGTSISMLTVVHLARRVHSWVDAPPTVSLSRDRTGAGWLWRWMSALTYIYSRYSWLDQTIISTCLKLVMARFPTVNMVYNINIYYIPTHEIHSYTM